MVPSPSWLDALKLPARVVVGVFISCVALLVLDQYKIISLASFGDLAKSTTIVMAVISGSLSLTSIFGFFIDKFEGSKKRSLLETRRKLKEQELKEKRAEFEKTALARIDHLAVNELSLLADSLRKNSQSFYAYAYSPYATTLASKGLISTPGGTHHQDFCPYTINDFAWKALLARKEEILMKDELNSKLRQR